MTARSLGRPFTKILIRVNNWIGDVVMISPAMRAIRRKYPGAEITLLAKPWVLEALRGNPVYDRLIEYDRQGAHAGWSGRLRLIQALRRERFDLAILFQKAFEAALFARAAGVPVRIGFRTDRRSWLLTHALDEPQEGHHVDRFLRLADALGCNTSDRRLHFHRTQQARDRATVFLDRAGISGPVLRVAVHPGASKAPRGWHPDRFAEVAIGLARNHPLRAFLLGSQAERPRLESLARRIGPAAVLPPLDWGLQEMAALLERCHLLVANDSGPMHIAAALRVPVVAIFGPGHPDRTGPYADPALFRVVTADYPCSPCRQRFFRECIPASSGKPYCLEDIPVEKVTRACQDMLAAQAESVPTRGFSDDGKGGEGGTAPSAGGARTPEPETEAGFRPRSAGGIGRAPTRREARGVRSPCAATGRDGGGWLPSHRSRSHFGAGPHPGPG